MNVQVSEWYVASCPECIPVIENLVQSAVRDATVTKLSIAAGHQHCHPVDKTPKPQRLASLSAVTASPGMPPSGDLFPVINSAAAPIPGEPPNGIDPVK